MNPRHPEATVYHQEIVNQTFTECRLTKQARNVYGIFHGRRLTPHTTSTRLSKAAYLMQYSFATARPRRVFFVLHLMLRRCSRTPVRNAPDTPDIRKSAQGCRFSWRHAARPFLSHAGRARGAVDNAREPAEGARWTVSPVAAAAYRQPSRCDVAAPVPRSDASGRHGSSVWGEPDQAGQRSRVAIPEYR